MLVKINPVSKPRQTRSDKWKERPSVMRYRAFADELRLKFGERVVPNTLIITFTLPMPESWSNIKKGKFDGRPHQQKPDLDNLVKSVMDALCKDDSYIYAIDADKYWGKQGSIEINVP